MSRLQGIIILSLILHGFTILSAFGQANKERFGLTKKEYKEVRKKVRKIPLLEQINTFILGQNNVIVTNIDTIQEIGLYPLPSAKALALTDFDYPESLADLLKVHYYYRIGNNEAKFYGLDATARMLHVSPYSSEKILPEALLKHDFVLSGRMSIDKWALQEKHSKAFKKQIKVKLLQSYLQDEQLPAINKSSMEIVKNYQNWVIQVYAANKEIHTSNSALHNLMADQVNPPDSNWLSELLTEQSVMGNFNRDGERLCLVEGSPRMFNVDTLLWDAVDTLISWAIRNEVMPGCQLFVAKEGYIILDKAYGYHTYDSLHQVNDQTLYDLASLTKVLATTQALILLYDKGKFDPDKKLSTYLPYLVGTNKQKITGSEVLSHQADLYPYYPFWKKAQEAFALKSMAGDRIVGSRLSVDKWVADSILHWAAESELLSERIDTVTQSQYFYSDVGFFFLKDAIEKIAGMSLDSFLMAELYKPNQLNLVFNPLLQYPDSLIAPTEFDKILRNELVRGYVHDRNAALFGGVAGQAGLFGNARNVANLMQIHLDHGRRYEQPVFSASAVQEFASRHFTDNRRGWGWDMPGLKPEGPVSRFASENTYGHTGFTGGMVWADPKENLIFVFLSNRVYPSAENNKLTELNIRTRIQDLIYQSLGYQ